MGVYTSNQEKGRKRRLIFGGLLLIILIICAVFIYFKWIYFPAISVHQINWSKQGVFPAAIVFDEQIITAPQDGEVFFDYETGDAIASGQVAISLSNTVAQASIQSEISKVEEQLKRYVIDDTSEQLAIISTKDKAGLELRTAIQNYALYLTKKDEAAIKNAFDKVKDLTDAYYDLKVNSDTELTSYNELKTNLAALNVELANCNQDIISDTSGLISFTFDGLSAILIPDALPLTDYRWFNQALSTREIESGNLVKTGDSLMRIITPDDYDLILNVPLKESMAFQYAHQLKLEFQDQVIDGALGQIINDQNQTFFYFKVNRVLPTLERFIDVALSTEEVVGFEIPRKAISQDDERLVVYCKDGLTRIQIEVEILLELDDTVIVKGLHEGDQVIKDSSKIGR